MPSMNIPVLALKNVHSVHCQAGLVEPAGQTLPLIPYASC
jgi:hypothetical protein